jgi:hypothetical protein
MNETKELQEINTIELENLIGELISFQNEHDSYQSVNQANHEDKISFEENLHIAGHNTDKDLSYEVTSNCTTSSLHFSPYDFDNMDMINDNNTKNLTTLSADTGYENPSFQHLNDSNDSNRSSSEVVVLRSKFNSLDSGSLSDLTEQRLSSFRKNISSDSMTSLGLQSLNNSNGKIYKDSSNAESIIDSIRSVSIYSMYNPHINDKNHIARGHASKKPAVPARPSSIFYGIDLNFKFGFVLQFSRIT